MFEGKPPFGRAALPLDLSNGENGELRVISWSELVAHFDAARELRSVADPAEHGGEGSFDPDSARHIAALGDDKPGVNFDDLANGKPAKGISRPTPNGAPGDDPRK